MKTKGIIGLMCAVFSLSSFAQETDKRFGFEFNTGASLATKKIDGASLQPGFGFEGTLHYRVINHLGVYAGWGWNRFGADESFAGTDVCYEETGYVFGLNYQHPVENSKLDYYARAGVLYNHVETENADGNIVNDTGHDVGFQLAAGLAINLGNNWSLTPGFKFHYLPQEATYEGTAIAMDYQYVSARVGIAKKF